MPSSSSAVDSECGRAINENDRVHNLGTPCDAQRTTSIQCEHLCLHPVYYVIGLSIARHSVASLLRSIVHCNCDDVILLFNMPASVKLLDFQSQPKHL